MDQNIQRARQLVVEAGLKLVKSGLIARTWGNISARVSDTQFVVTPKGRGYETLKPEDIVLLNIEDCSYKGDIKPSSEKGIHAAVYKLRKDINFVIHTHQLNASVLSVLGQGIKVTKSDQDLLGDYVPNAAYGISSTKKLAKNAAKAIKDNPKSVVFLLRSHGAFSLGGTIEEAFDRVFALEQAAEKEIYRLTDVSSLEELRNKYIRQFVNEVNFTPKSFKNIRIPDDIVKFSKTNHIIYDDNPDVSAVSANGKTFYPYIDDVAQIIGVSIRNGKIEDALNNLKGRSAVLIQGAGALCVGVNEFEAQAVEMILRKQCLCAMLVALTNIDKPLGTIDSWLQRLVYTHKYSKMKG
ncbi:MAG: class II aldolase/adducin family protein [Bacilli bacterium]|jgi:L-fuculose-phosphate aldolase